MQKQLTKVGKVQFTIEVPSTIEEHQAKHGGRDGVTLAKAINYDVAHTILGKIRSKVGDALVELGAKKDVASTAPDGTITYKALDTKWIDRQFVALGLTLPEQQVLFQKVADEIGYDVSGTRGENKPYNQVDLKDAKALLTSISLGKSSFERVKANLEKVNPGLEVIAGEDGSISEENLAAALKVHRTRIESEQQNALL